MEDIVGVHLYLKLREMVKPLVASVRAYSHAADDIVRMWIPMLGLLPFVALI